MSLPPLSPPGGSGGPKTLKGWDVARVGNQVLPGIWRLIGGGYKLKVDHHRKHGADGNNPVLHGIELGELQLEGRQWTDEQRDELVKVCSKILPARGAIALPPATTNSNGVTVGVTGPPLVSRAVSLQHPSVQHWPFPVNVIVLGASILEVVGPCWTRITIYLLGWMPTKSSDAPAINQPTAPTRDINNDITRKLNNPNPKPTDVPGIAGPPVGFKPGQ